MVTYKISELKLYISQFLAFCPQMAARRQPQSISLTELSIGCQPINNLFITFFSLFVRFSPNLVGNDEVFGPRQSQQVLPDHKRKRRNKRLVYKGVQVRFLKTLCHYITYRWEIIKNNSFRQDEVKTGTLKGTDKYGNKYYENNYYFYGRNRWVEYAPQYCKFTIKF